MKIKIILNVLQTALRLTYVSKCQNARLPYAWTYLLTKCLLDQPIKNWINSLVLHMNCIRPYCGQSKCRWSIFIRICIITLLSCNLHYYTQNLFQSSCCFLQRDSVIHGQKLQEKQSLFPHSIGHFLVFGQGNGSIGDSLQMRVQNTLHFDQRIEGRKHFQNAILVILVQTCQNQRNYRLEILQYFDILTRLRYICDRLDRISLQHPVLALQSLQYDLMQLVIQRLDVILRKVLNDH